MEMDLPIDTGFCPRGTDGVCLCVCLCKFVASSRLYN
jgi:hypothetical protein